MPRTREFDADDALERAMDVLWTKGYEATSLDDLCAATGLSRSSFYAAFGSKRNLLLRSVQRYSDRRTPNIETVLDQPLPIRDGFTALLRQFIDQIVAGTGRRGCFLGNCAAELPRNDRAAMAEVRKGMGRTEAVFREALERAQARGELRPSANAEALARFLTAGIQGLRLVGKVNADRATLEDIASTMLRCLDQPAASYGKEQNDKDRPRRVPAAAARST
jgi:TetR/AcrR family transcriptional repressor of nem operon